MDGAIVKPIPDFPEFDFNFPERSGPAKVRQQLTRKLYPTRMVLSKRVMKMGEGSDSQKQLDRVCKQAGFPAGGTAQQAINVMLQSGFEEQWRNSVFEVDEVEAAKGLSSLEQPTPQEVNIFALGQ